ncbi:hypothetical protein BKA70DRAFT_322014 [Coprinopsis sp. MPI-PUGE-AT-0042]|nr:hypothetical protein BKA70DRAFT_322014 [Coprinopsis sp. MPI-PUGE-AT-0042]
MPLDDLPSELYSAIIEHLPEEDYRFTAVSLIRALPHSPVSNHHLYKKIRIGKPEQAVACYLHFRKVKNEFKDDINHGSCPLTWIQSLSIESWSVDADVVLNMVSMLPRAYLESFNLWIGANNFNPEHLEEMFEKPFENLAYLSIRFRPYVKRASYYQFLKGAYFDSSLLALSRWPASSLPVLSIVQDPLDPAMIPSPTNRQGFAQPLVFFKLDPNLSILLQSPSFVTSLNAFRLRVPSRPVVRSLCTPPLMSEDKDGEPIRMPNIHTLDLSTSGVIEGEVDLLLVHFKDLQHLLLDDSGILKSDLREGDWSVLGKRCALAGTRRAKDCEKALQAWYERRILAVPAGSDGSPAVVQDLARRPRRGRRGLSTPTISIRSRTPPPGGRAPDPNLPSSVRRQGMPKFRILPPVPSLRTLCSTVSSTVPQSSWSTIQDEFAAGWAEGIAQLAVKRGRMRESARVGTKVLRFKEGGEECDPPEGDITGLFTHAAKHGLEVVSLTDMEAFDTLGTSGGDPKDIPTPVLCLAGREDGFHAENCGHSVVQLANLWPRLTD